MAEAPQPFSLPEISNMFGQLQQAKPDVYGNMSMQDFSNLANTQSNSHIFDAGTASPWTAPLRWPGALVSEATKPFGEMAQSGAEGVMNAMGLPQYAEPVGRAASGIPEAAATIGLGELTGYAALVPLLFGSETYANTGSPLQGATSAATAAVLPGIGKAAGDIASNLGIKAFGSDLPVVAGDGFKVLHPLTQGAIREIGSTSGQLLTNEASGEAQNYERTGELYNPLTSDHIISSLAGQLPWTGLSVYHSFGDTTYENSVKDHIATAATKEAMARQSSEPVGQPSVANEPVSQPSAPVANVSSEPSTVRPSTEEIPAIKQNIQQVVDKPMATATDDLGTLTKTAKQLGAEPELNSNLTADNLKSLVAEKSQTTFPPEEGVARAVQVAKNSTQDAIEQRLSESTPIAAKPKFDLSQLSPEEQQSYVQGTRKAEATADPIAAQKEIDRTTAKLVSDGQISKKDGTVIPRGSPEWAGEFGKQLSVAVGANRGRLYRTSSEPLTEWSKTSEGQMAHAQWKDASSDVKDFVATEHRKNLFEAVQEDLSNSKIFKSLKLSGTSPEDQVTKLNSVLSYLTRDLSDPRVRKQSNDQLAKDLGVQKASLSKALKGYKTELAKLPSFQEYLRGGEANESALVKASPSQLFGAIAKAQGWSKPFTDRVSLVASKMIDNLRRWPSIANTTFGLISSPSAIDQGIRGVFTEGQIGLSAEGRLKQQELDGMSALLTLGHETFHAIDADIAAGRANSTEIMTRSEMGKLAESMSPEQRAEVLQAMHEALVPADFKRGLPKATQDALDDGVMKGATYAARTPNEFVAEMAGLLSLGKSSEDNPQNYKSAREALNAMNYDAQSFSRMMFTNLSGVAHLLRAHFDARGLGIVDTADGPISVGDAFTKLVKGYEDLTKPLPETETALKSLQQQVSLSPTNIASQWQNAADGKPWTPIIDPFKGSPEYSIIKPASDYFREKLGLEGKVGPIASNLVDALQPQVVSDIYPQTKPVWDLLGAAKGNANVHAFDVFQTMGGADGNLLERLNPKGSPSRKAFKALAEKQQRSEAADGSLPLMPEDQARAFLTQQGFTGKAQDDAIEAQKNAAIANLKNIDKIDSWQTNSIKNLVNFPLFQKMLPKTTAFADVDAIANNFTQAFSAMSQATDPQQKMALMVTKIEPLLASFQQDPNNAALLASLFKTNEGLFQTKNTSLAYLKSRPGWLSEARQGDFLLSYKKDGEPQFDGFKSKQERDAFIKSKAGQQGYSELNPIDRDPTNDASWAVSNRGDLTKILSTSLASLDAASANLSPEDAAKLKEQINPLRDTLQELVGRGLKQTAQQREGIGGENIDYLEGLRSYTNMVANMAEKQNVREQAANLFNSPGLKEQPFLVQKLQRNVEARLSPKEYSWITDAKKAAASYRLLYNPIADIWEAGQIGLTGIPGLMEGGPKTKPEGPLKALGRLSSASADFVSHTRSTMSGEKSPLSEDLAAALHDAEIRGTFHKNPIQDYLGQFDADSMKTLGNAEGSAVEKGLHAMKADFLVNALQGVGKITSFIPEAMSKSLYIAGYRRGIEHGLSPMDAAKEGEYSAQHGLPDVSAGQRPGMFVSGNKFWNSVGGTVYSGNAFMMAAYNMFTRAGIRAAKGEPGAVGTLVGLLALQQVAAGVFGQPGVQPVLGLLKQQFPQANPEAKLQELAKTFFQKMGANEPFSNLLTDSAFHGAPRAMGAPFDAYHLFSLDQVGPFTPEGFQVGPHQLGRTAGIVGDFLHAISLASTGKYQQAAELAAPTPINHILETWRTQGKVVDGKGNLLYDPTTAQKWAGAFGLESTKQVQLREQKELQDREEEASTSRQNVQLEQMAKSLTNGDTLGVRQQMLSMKQQNPALDVPGLVQELSQRAVSQVAAYNPKNATGPQGNMLSRGQIANLVPPGATPSTMSEMQRLMLQNQFERSLGFPTVGRLSLEAVQHAQRVDQMMAASPSLTREEANYQVDRMNLMGARRFAVGSQ